jgi:DNA-directed RNA polymerase subunit beta'
MKDIFNFFEKPKDPFSFSAIRISLASRRRSSSGPSAR